MNIGLLSDSFKMPNIALMKLATFHKSVGDDVSLFEPLFAHEYDKVYYSKIFTFTPLDLYAHGDVDKGGTGFDLKKQLPKEIDDLPCDYSIYSEFDYAVGFLTRGCIRKCSWCVVPEKEGTIKPYNSIEQIARSDNDKLVLLDNNVLASDYGLSEIERLTKSKYKVDFNQGLDARLITKEVARLLARVKWLKYIRVSCDTSDMAKHVVNAYENLKLAGYKKELFCYVLAKEFEETMNRLVILEGLDKITPFVQPYRDFNLNTEPPKLLKELSRWVNRKWLYKSKNCSFENYLQARNMLGLIDEITPINRLGLR